ncbi:phage tail assembly chaperone [Martelella lutilitoris]|uniref:Phage tail assembly chaperone n=1 Tax=Martelella lutilitoris TaxID=2583532 RepID=A0A7T7HP00_9HYPH|nr:phage tail assembly chaperone [Martelella lutilitoris]
MADRDLFWRGGRARASECDTAGPFLAAAAGPEPPGAEPFPWRSALHTGLCLLRLKPEDFWSLTPVEFAAMSGAFAPAGPYPTRAGLEEMMMRYPDDARKT